MKDKFNLGIRGLNYVTKRNISSVRLHILQSKFGTKIGYAKKQPNQPHGSDHHICLVKDNNNNINSTATHSPQIVENNQVVKTVFLSHVDFYNNTKNHPNFNKVQYIFYRDSYNMQRANLSAATLAKVDEQEVTRWFYLFELQSNYPAFWKVLDRKLNQISQDNSLANIIKFTRMRQSTDNMLCHVFVDYSTPSYISTPILL